MKRANDKAGTEISVPAFSVLKKPRRVRRPQAANRIKSFSAATPSAILAAQPLRPTLKICRRHIFKRCGVAENTSHPASVEFVCFRQTNYARSRVQPFRKSGRSHFFDSLKAGTELSVPAFLPEEIMRSCVLQGKCDPPAAVHPGGGGVEVAVKGILA